MDQNKENTNCVVIVDSDKLHADLIGSKLEGEGYSVKIRGNVEDAIHVSGKTEDVIAVLLQNHESEAELKNSVRKLKEKYGASILLIMMDAFSLEALRTAVQTGFHEFLARPVGHEELITLLKRKKQGVKPRKISMTIKLEATIDEDNNQINTIK